MCYARWVVFLDVRRGYYSGRSFLRMLLERYDINAVPSRWAHWREVIHFDDPSQFKDPAGGKFFQSGAVLGGVQIRSSTVKYSNSGIFQIFLEFPVFWRSHT